VRLCLRLEPPPAVNVDQNELATAIEATDAALNTRTCHSVLSNMGAIAGEIKEAMDMFHRPGPFQRRGEWCVLIGTTFGFACVHRKYIRLYHPWTNSTVYLLYVC